MPRKALGKGLEALISQKGREKENVLMIPVESIQPNPFQPRANTDDSHLEELVESVKEKGILQPVLVTRRAGKYVLVAGERRWRAARRAGLQSIPALVQECSDEEMLLIALIENIQRENLNPIEEARAYLKLIKEFHMTQEEVAKRVGKPRTTVANMIRLLKLPQKVQTLLSQERISVGHAKVLLSLEDKHEQIEFAQRIVREGWSVRELERRIQLREKQPRKKQESIFEQPDWVNVRRELERWMGSKVVFRSKGKKSIVVNIVFKNMDEFENFYERMKNLFREE